MVAPLIEENTIGAVLRTSAYQYCLIEISEYKRYRHLFHKDTPLHYAMAYFPAIKLFRAVLFNSTHLILESQ